MNFDTLLRSAAAEAEEILLTQLPESQPHAFSPAFEKKIRKLNKRSKHPIRYQALRYAAAVLLVILTLFGAVLAVSPEVRASVIGWVKSTYSGHAVEYSTVVKDDAVRHNYRLGYLLAGYSLHEVHENPDYKIYYYATKNAARFLKFGCFYPSGESGNSVFLWTEGYEQYSGFVHGMKADIYITDDWNHSNMIVWCDEETGVIFCVVAYADQETLVRLAESVEIADPTPWE